jgi:Xaa-Pro aminopeptidase
MTHNSQIVQQALSNFEIAALIIPSSDPHMSEYVAQHWKEREWVSGFNGSAGTAVITRKDAALWTDSRYFLQAEQQLRDSGINLMKQGLITTPTIAEWLGANLEKKSRVGINSRMISVNTYNSLQADLQKFDIQLTTVDVIGKLWIDRPALPLLSCFFLDIKYSGASLTDKVQELRKIMHAEGCDVHLVTALDDVAWLFNIRGNDVDYNPVVIAYAVVDKDDVHLFVDRKKLNKEMLVYLTENSVAIHDYSEIDGYLKSLKPESRVLIDPDKTNMTLYQAIPNACSVKKSATSPVAKLKSIKNDIEVKGFHLAMVKDAVALIKFFMWFENAVHTGDVTELSLAVALRNFRADQPNFVGESFGTIAGYADHGAIQHYSANETTNYKIKPENILLLDSGAQFLDGTTDITRTIILSEPSAIQKRDFTLVLKGHIALASIVFPYGTKGHQLDVLARMALWSNGFNYGHGTAHGVGHFLCVHEGPQGIRPDENPTVLEPNMILSNEPGIYRTGEYGIRIENLVRVVEKFETEFGRFLAFETITLFPIDQNLIERSLLLPSEIEWINAYHKEVYTKVIPFLSPIEAEWLKIKCQEI